MKFIISSLLILGLTGCNRYYPPKYEKLYTLSNDELCLALGTYNDESKVVLKIHDELIKRKVKVNYERCHALEVAAKENNNTHTINALYNDTNYSRANAKIEADLLRQINKINRAVEMPKQLPQLYRTNPRVPFPSDGFKNQMPHQN